MLPGLKAEVDESRGEGKALLIDFAEGDGNKFFVFIARAEKTLDFASTWSTTHPINNQCTIL